VEGCFNAKIDPQTKVAAISDEQFKKLQLGVIQALKDGVLYGGSTKTHFVDADGKKGLFLDYAKVYNRDKKPCLVCGTKIQKIKLGGRGTFFCPSCQK
jgi:formamidopyrimidine-DNA glycosylase